MAMRTADVVDVVIVSYNCKAVLAKCLNSLRECSSFLQLNTIVVDNASSDGTAHAIREGYKDVKVIANELNLGFAMGCNQGIVAGASDLVLLLNPDCRITMQSLKALIGCMRQRPDAACVAPRLTKGGDVLEPVYKRIVTLREFLFKMLFLDRAASSAQRILTKMQAPSAIDGPKKVELVHQVDYVEGACILCRRLALLSVGLLDPRYFLYFEDQDLCLRFRNAGLGVLLHNGVEVQHLQGQSAKREVERTVLESYRSVCYFFKKYRTSSSCIALRMTIAVGAVLRLAVFAVAGALRCSPEAANRNSAYRRVLRELVIQKWED
ncbi:glycosyltransferase family 2 protein [bacterium]|nr:glycosyltransferase family 2 protein [bacterium]